MSEKPKLSKEEKKLLNQQKKEQEKLQKKLKKQKEMEKSEEKKKLQDPKYLKTKHLQTLTVQESLCLEKLKKIQEEISKADFQLEQEQKTNEKELEVEIKPYIKEINDLMKSDVKNYWLIILKNSSIFSELNERDEECLKNLMNITINEYEDEKYDGFKLNFHFSENEFFANDILTKSFLKLKEKKSNDSLKPKGMKIDWKLKKELNLKYGKSKKIMPKPCDSFFNFFNEKQKQEQNFIDLDIFEVIKEELIPNALKYYLGTEEPIDILSNEYED
eukprot:gene3707-6596_t